jgi:hypothetical protein
LNAGGAISGATTINASGRISCAGLTLPFGDLIGTDNTQWLVRSIVGGQGIQANHTGNGSWTISSTNNIANQITLTRNDSTNENYYIPFVSTSINAFNEGQPTGLSFDNSLVYNPATNVLNVIAVQAGFASSANNASYANTAGYATKADYAVMLYGDQNYTINSLIIGTGVHNIPLQVNRSVYSAWTANPASNYLFGYNAEIPGFGSIYYSGVGNQSFNNNWEQWNISVYAVNFVVAGWGFGTNSDRRIKCNISEIDDNAALKDFRLLKPSKYNLRRNVNLPSEYGFIAQEVQTVIPNAVSRSTDFIFNFSCFCNVSKLTNDPNLMLISYKKIEDIDQDFVKRLNIKWTEDFNQNEFKFVGNHDENGNEYKNDRNQPASDQTGKQEFKVKIKSLDTGKEIIVKTKEIIDNLHFIVYCKDIDHDELITEGDYYATGQEVDDFHIVNKDMIWALAASALQEVDRQQLADKIRISELEVKVAEQQSIITQQQETINQILSRLDKAGL